MIGLVVVFALASAAGQAPTGTIGTIQGIGLSCGRARSLEFSGHRFQLTDQVTRQSGRHTLRFGLEWERTVSTNSQIDRDPAQIALWSPSEVRQRNTSIPLPSAFTTIDDLLRLPLRSFETLSIQGQCPNATL